MTVKILNGLELAGFIKERQAKAVRNLRQEHRIIPRLAIIKAKDDPVIDTYVGKKKQYGSDIQIEVDIHDVPQAEVLTLIDKLNKDDTVHGMIVQLPLTDDSQQEEILNHVAAQKDVDGLGKNPPFDPATPTAILWLLAGHNIDIQGKHVVIVGKGRLVGSPLTRILRDSGVNVTVVDSKTEDFDGAIRSAEVLVTATGVAGLIRSDIVSPGSVVVDAGVAVESGRTVGDVAEDVYSRDDIAITPVKGGVGPLTVCALFDNVIKAARNAIPNNQENNQA